MKKCEIKDGYKVAAAELELEHPCPVTSVATDLQSTALEQSVVELYPNPLKAPRQSGPQLVSIKSQEVERQGKVVTIDEELSKQGIQEIEQVQRVNPRRQATPEPPTAG